MYTAVMLIVAGATIRTGSFVVLAEAMVLAVLLNVKTRWEERRLIETFPGYRDHQKVTGRFIPSRGGWARHRGTPRTPSRKRRNRIVEYPRSRE